MHGDIITGSTNQTFVVISCLFITHRDDKNELRVLGFVDFIDKPSEHKNIAIKLYYVNEFSGMKRCWRHLGQNYTDKTNKYKIKLLYHRKF